MSADPARGPTTEELRARVLALPAEPTTDARACACGHAADWHSHGGTGDCEHDAACGCRGFAPGETFARPSSYPLGFEYHASPEAIAAHMAQAREHQAALSSELGWLEALYLRRVAEKARGAWPPLDSEGAERP